MGRNSEKDAVEMAAKNQRILENGFRIFAENNIEKVTMLEVAKAAGISVASLYRYYSTKPRLVMAIGTWAWDRYAKEDERREAAKPDRTAAEIFDAYLEAFLDLYRNHKDLLRFNQFFNIYLQSEAVPQEDKRSYMDMIGGLERRFGIIYRKALQDGTLRTDLPERKMFAATLHLMLAVTTRYAMGLVYGDEADAEAELQLQKDMLMQRFIRKQ